MIALTVKYRVTLLLKIIAMCCFIPTNCGIVFNRPQKAASQNNGDSRCTSPIDLDRIFGGKS